MLICLDAGHGGYDPGTISYGRLFKESALNLTTVLFLEEYLIANKVKTITTRNKDVFVSLKDRGIIANKAKANFFISIHYNSSTNPSARGSESCVYSKTKIHPVIKELGKSLAKHTGFYDRGIIERQGLQVLRQTNMPAILLEIGFISNPEELSKCKSTEFQKRVAMGIGGTLIDALSSNYKKDMIFYA